MLKDQTVHVPSSLQCYQHSRHCPILPLYLHATSSGLIKPSGEQVFMLAVILQILPFCVWGTKTELQHLL